MSAAAHAPVADDRRLTVAIASKPSLRPAWQQLVGLLRHRGTPVRVISTWIDEIPGPDSNWNQEWMRSIDEAASADLLLARVCVDDNADVVAVQVGAALGAGKQVAILGSHPLLDRLSTHPRVDFRVPDAAPEAIDDVLRARGRLP